MIILNEVRYAEELLKNGFIYSYRKVSDILILSKYYYYLGLEQEEVKYNIMSFIKKYDAYFNEIYWYKIVNITIKKAQHYKIKVFNPIVFTENEMKTICSQSKPILQKLLFIFLFMYKVNNHKGFKISYREINRMLSCRFSYEKISKYIYILISDKLVLNHDEKNKVVTFCDENSPECLVIKDDRDILMYYYKYMGGDVVECEQCGKLIKQTSNVKKYCGECYKIHRNEYQKLLMRERRNDVSK